MEVLIELKDIASLPEQLQVILVSGYLGYTIWYNAKRCNCNLMVAPYNACWEEMVSVPLLG